MGQQAHAVNGKRPRVLIVANCGAAENEREHFAFCYVLAFVCVLPFPSLRSQRNGRGRAGLPLPRSCFLPPYRYPGGNRMLIIQLGSQGANVRLWLRFLRKHGFMSYSSGDKFGRGMDKATRKFQDAAAVFADGIVGPITTAAAKGSPYLFAGFEVAEDEQSLADRAGIPPEVLKAVQAVESGGDSQAVRFEPHVFLRIRKDLAGQVNYTPGNGVVWSTTASETNRQAFEAAFLLDPFAAVRSTSWGAFQVLGAHLLDEHEGDPRNSVQAFDNDPQGQSAILLTRWFGSNPKARLAANLRPPDFETLALCYNGPHAAKHGYPRRLRSAWLKAKTGRK